ncbi:hypothetical protein JTB14_015504 [Gonioctena quinquepunctata]|nr:hypothetical protein JTB14_015504 [Gonioctena quinquepunctata]
MNRTFLVQYQDEESILYPIEAGVPKGTVLGPMLYLLYTADLLSKRNIITATYADDTAILFSHHDPNAASLQLQMNLEEIQTWLNKANEAKSIHITFTNRKATALQ